ncbi:hypothetical protein FT663_00797 [Candidozyma haemuli var. vulneris]|uniref:superoxide dismutase n=1 Tax=Candidozyma haemuli TaxID=45357 RepID=A0A2V1AQ52_9ASCO|nr:hypothetical protein CXQ85_001647 [[Candida] haemuloni]KAF3992887.1 hypothetical protein FT662_00889 [[Candida] haemuloni var. vulneris]KAF3995098.1 hypothetical protein FT663_00797 [[Candida] haemuloni var. vulneris]PVH19872.1 hypothetical protein CXQ85_001647 [[Candida] haemuloni]
MRFTKFNVASSICFSSLCGAVLAGVAPVITSNPKNAIAVAEFPQFGCGEMEGYVSFESPHGGKVDVQVDVTKLPSDGGPFYYHIHEYPVPDDGDCEKVGPEFNPYHASPDCDAQPGDAYCKLGDLSGKYGKIKATCFQTEYCDPFISLDGYSKANIIGRSLVFHYSDMTKIACANIEVGTEEQLDRLRSPSCSDSDSDDEDVDFVFDKREVGSDQGPTTTFVSSTHSWDGADGSATSGVDAGDLSSGQHGFATKVSNSSITGNRTNVSNFGHESACPEEGAANSVKAAFGTLFGLLTPFLL